MAKQNIPSYINKYRMRTEKMTYDSKSLPKRKRSFFRKTFPSLLQVIIPFVASLSVIYGENRSTFFWDSFDNFSKNKALFSQKEISEQTEEKEEHKVRFFSSLTFKYPYEMKAFQEYIPTESAPFDSIPGLPNRFPNQPKIHLQKKEFFALYPSFGREEVFIMSMAQNKENKSEAYVGANTERRAYDSLTDMRATSSVMPGLGSNLSRGLDNQAGNLLFGYLLGRAGIQMDLGWRMAGNNVGLAIPESAKSSIGIIYSLIPNSSSLNKMDFFLQVSGIKRFNDKSFLPIDTPQAFKGWLQGYEYYVNPGFSISTKNLSFEGLVRLPLHQQPFPTTDGFLAPEIQGILGVKYKFSESSPNLQK
ncbi:LIC_20087 family outer membrane protein [Leptospira koniambonensis]|uniref:LIC_20087 family outer membrane protein n=1 Tax=Leptospira koniambonensis TaxID=2484950 RepID=UPI003EC0456D